MSKTDAIYNLPDFSHLLPIRHPAIKRRIKALKKIQLEYLNSEVELYKELHALELKFHERHQSLFQKRASIVNGVHEPTDEECDFPSDSEDESDAEEGADGSDVAAKNVEDDKKKDATKVKEEKADVTVDIKSEEKAQAEDIKGIPEFWLTILKSMSIFKRCVQPEDEPVLKHLTDIQIRLEKEPKVCYPGKLQ